MPRALLEAVSNDCARVLAAQARLEAALLDAGPEVLARAVAPSGLSPTQVVQHMVVSHACYAVALEDCASRLPAGDGAGPAVRTWLGRQLERAAGPGGSAPMPAAFRPKGADPGLGAVAEHAGIVERLGAAAGLLAAKELRDARIANPVFRVFRMTLADAYAVVAAHCERHVAQIEEAVR